MASANVVGVSEGESPLKKMKTDIVYKWGFDLTSFNDKLKPEADSVDSVHAKIGDSNLPTGVVKFQSLLDLFELEYMPYLGLTRAALGYREFIWQSKSKDILLVTYNNPITGQYGGPFERKNEKGYLSYVGVECKSLTLRVRFLEEFRKRATYIKGEANDREFI